MQDFDDAALDYLDSLDSLVIFDRICPFAIEHLPPAMSRRVFDVGLDMGRIRNGLKSKQEKRSKSFRSTQASHQDDAVVDDEQSPHEKNAIIPKLKHKKSFPTKNSQPSHQRNQNENQPMSGDKYPLPPLETTAPGSGKEEGSLYSSQTNANQENSEQPHGPEHVRHDSDGLNFDLKPPPPKTRVKNIDSLSERLHSGEHLRLILSDPSFFLRFTAFLNRYRPYSAPVLVRYLEAQKAIKAVEYANALAGNIKLPAPPGEEEQGPMYAASIDPRFQAALDSSFESLVTHALPAYITTCLTKVVTESMVREITGHGLPVMRELVDGLAEVFCLADPSIEDCPIVYASAEFYRTTRYSRDDVLGRNCRFLQGPKTDRATIARLGAAIKRGQESCETVLNYKRDGTPFMNLLLTAPLYDNRGGVRYFIGAQIDVSGLIEDGRGLDSFERLLKEPRSNKNRESQQSDSGFSQRHLKALNEFSQMLSMDETAAFQTHSRNSSMTDNASNYNSRQAFSRHDPSVRTPRRVLGNDDDEDHPQHSNSQATLQPTSSLSSGGKLPGVYQNYLLVRPHPSLRIIFVSPALRIPGLLQSPFLSHIGGPPHVRGGLSDAFEQGAAVTAKITWLPRAAAPAADNDADATTTANSSTNGDLGTSRPSSSRRATSTAAGSAGEARTRYISCTPLLGSDDQVGVWMVVMVENELVTGSLTSRERALARYHGEPGVPVPPTPSEYEREDAVLRERGPSTYGRRGRDKVGSEGGRLYADFMRGKGEGAGIGNGDGVKGAGEEDVDGDAGKGDRDDDEEGGRILELRSPAQEKRGSAGYV